MLETCMKFGITALKTQFCDPSTKNSECPTCHDSIHDLGVDLPHMLFENTSLISAPPSIRTSPGVSSWMASTPPPDADPCVAVM